MSHPIQPGLFDLPQVEPAPEPEPEQMPIDGTVTWKRTAKKVSCVDCWHQQAADHAAGRPVARRERARVQMVNGADKVDLCNHHARDRGWKGSS